MIFQLSYNNFAEKLVFPVNPPKFRVYGGGTEFHDFTVVKGGERTTIGDIKMREISFSSLFPRHYDSFLCEYVDIPHPYDALNTIQRWRKTKWPVRLIITDLGVNMAVTIRKFEYEERGGEPGDIYFDIAFKEYEFIRIREVEQNGDEIVMLDSTSRTDLSVNPITYQVQASDYLWLLAERFYGDGGKWGDIYDANRNTIDLANAGQMLTMETIHPGQWLVIP